MTLPFLISDCDLLIKKEQTTIRLYLSFSIGLVLAGIILFFFGNQITTNEVTKSIISIGGIFISSMTTFPIKEIISAQRRISSCKILKSKIESIQKDELNIEKIQLDNLISYLWELYKKLME